ncbi:leiomodin-3 isoform X2 [Hydra vulgaris]|uniref:leiomodin-3 isoform X2 n=1 Tax=Hydra vulgaris TaxID=6087 RepID=UPI0006415D19|nr:leiomodin-3 isoform X2 [Hydra vulgaris]XP_047130123.1 leiomodin-3 isoform X2 [Hydra vulgaris]
MPYSDVESTRRRVKSFVDEDSDLDVNILLKCLMDDTDEIFCIRINNIKIDTLVLYAIFEALKTTKKICHLSLAGLNINDERGLVLNEALKENTTLQTLNLESNDLTNLVIEPLCAILETHKTLREFKCSHQKNGLGSRGEEAMARALNKNNQLLKISYPFKVPSARSLADRCHIRNQELLRQKRAKGEDFYNYNEEIKKRDEHPQPWIKEINENKNEVMRFKINEQRRSMRKVPDITKMRIEAKQRAVENAKPIIDNELSVKLAIAKRNSGVYRL